MSKPQLPIALDAYAKGQIARYIGDQLRHYLDLPDPDDEMRDIEDGLDLSFHLPADSCVIGIRIDAYKADGSRGKFTKSNYHDIISALLHLNPELPDGLVFFEIFNSDHHFIDIRYIIDYDSPLRCWYDANLRC